MSQIDTIRAWKDPEYRDSLSEAQKAQLPENPAGSIELTDEDMSSLSGGHTTTPPTTCPICCRPKLEEADAIYLA